MTEKRSALSDLAEQFIKQMRWSHYATESEKTIAIGNVRGFVSWVEGLPEDPLSNQEEAMIDAAWKRHSGAAQEG